jgi:hypothetical protein
VSLEFSKRLSFGGTPHLEFDQKITLLLVSAVSKAVRQGLKHQDYAIIQSCRTGSLWLKHAPVT